MERRKTPSATSRSDAPERVQEHAPERAALGDAAGDGVGQRDAHQEREARLDGVVQRAAGPVDVRLVIGQEAPEAAAGEVAAHTRELHHLGHHQQHDEAAIGIHRQITDCRLGNLDGFRWQRPFVEAWPAYWMQYNPSGRREYGPESTAR